MATEKTLKTRILLRYDTHDNWITNDPVLKAGEVALSTVSVKQNGTVNFVPSVLIKVGDGTHKYSELDFAYAKAADVLEACKTSEGLTAFVNGVINDAGIATDEALNTLTARVTTAEGDIDALEEKVGAKAVATQISDAIAALKLSETYEAKGEAAKVSSALNDYKTANDAVIAGIKTGTVINDFKSVETELGNKQAKGDYATKTEAQGYANAKDDAIAAAKKAGTDAQTAVDNLSAKVGTVADGTTIVKMISDAQAAATYDDTTVKADIKKNKEDIASLNTLVGSTAVATQISDAVSAAKTELKGGTSDTDASATISGAKKYADKLDSAMDARVDALETAIGEGGDVGAQITAKINTLDKADEAVAGKYVSAVSETDGIITVTRADLPDYSDTYAAKSHTHTIANVTGLQTELDKVATLIGDDVSKSVRTIANEELAAQLIPANAKESLDTLQEIAQWIQDHPEDASEMKADIASLKEKVGTTSVADQIATVTDPIAEKAHTHSNKTLLDGYDQTNANIKDAVDKKHSHANKAELDKFAEGDKAKLDSAVQSITGGTGLKATKTGTGVSVDFDDTVVWIFDCGSSTDA